MSREGIRTSPSEGQRVPILLVTRCGRLLVTHVRSGSVWAHVSARVFLPKEDLASLWRHVCLSLRALEAAPPPWPCGGLETSEFEAGRVQQACSVPTLWSRQQAVRRCCPPRPSSSAGCGGEA